MSDSANKALSRRFTELFGTDDVSLADDVFTGGVVFHGAVAGGDLHGVEAVKEFVAAYRAAFPDARSTVEEQIAEGDRVATRWRARGTHRGPLGDLPATGREFVMEGMTIERIEGDRIAEVWVARDELGLMRQLGVVREREAADAA
jgi:steroid delta-isomerase-like uncharacterized protein